MPNSFFQFKQFRIDQDKCAMKVCTDSCILGAFADAEEAKRILDIGTGTGLLSLMIAQKSNALIDAVEIEEKAFEQAKQNFSNSRWKDRLTAIHTTIQNFAAQSPPPYDLIVCNPPFFSKQLKSSSKNRNIALHSEALSLQELIQSVLKLLTPEGRFAVLLPAYEFGILQEVALRDGLYVNKLLKIRDKEALPLLRIVAELSFKNNSFGESELVIKNEEGKYTESFKQLLNEYYLHL